MKEFTFFYGGVFSQWYQDRKNPQFLVDGGGYNCTEQYMMACKARLFGDDESLAKIMAAEGPREQKKLGRGVTPFDRDEWNRQSRDFVFVGNLAKFTQNADFFEEMMSSRGTTIVEASGFDKLWGIGLWADDDRALDAAQWQGVNWLGEVLTKLRDALADSDIRTLEDLDSQNLPLAVPNWSDTVHIYEETPPV